MANSFFQFKQFTIHQDRCAMKVTSDGSLFGAWIAKRIRNREPCLQAGRLGAEQTEMQVGSGCILDIGTGTGLLALMIAQTGDFTIDAVEIDQEAFEQASENIASSPWAEQVKVIYGDAREYKFSNQYDIIISNPPFYETELKGDDAKKNLAHHNEGLLVPELLTIIKNNLKSNGSFYLLLPYKRNEEIKKMFIENNMAIQHFSFVRQSLTHDYFRIMLEGKLNFDKMDETSIDEISIKNSEDQYTPVFVNLLKDYYLHL